MTYTIANLKDLDQDSLDKLTVLHCQVMNTLLSELGSVFVKKYYLSAQIEAGVIGGCAISDQGEILGWVMGSNNPARLNSMLKKPIYWFIFQILMLWLKHPSALVELGKSILLSSTANTLKKSQCELTYIGVATAAQGKGLGRQLIFRFIEQAKQTGYNSIALSVETDNPAAIALYKKCGFQIADTFQEGRFHRHRMVLEIN